MITKWKVFNFKSIQKETELDFTPLTFLIMIRVNGEKNG